MHSQRYWRENIFLVFVFPGAETFQAFPPKTSPIWKDVYSGLHRHRYPPNRRSQKYPQYATSRRVWAFGWSFFSSSRSDEWVGDHVAVLIYTVKSANIRESFFSSLQPVGSPEAKKQPKKTARDNLMDGDNRRVCIRPLWHSNDLQQSTRCSEPFKCMLAGLHSFTAIWEHTPPANVYFSSNGL